MNLSIMERKYSGSVFMKQRHWLVLGIISGTENAIFKLWKYQVILKPEKALRGKFSEQCLYGII